MSLQGFFQPSNRYPKIFQHVFPLEDPQASSVDSKRRWVAPPASGSNWAWGNGNFEPTEIGWFSMQERFLPFPDSCSWIFEPTVGSWVFVERYFFEKIVPQKSWNPIPETTKVGSEWKGSDSKKLPPWWIQVHFRHPKIAEQHLQAFALIAQTSWARMSECRPCQVTTTPNYKHGRIPS